MNNGTLYRITPSGHDYQPLIRFLFGELPPGGQDIPPNPVSENAAPSTDTQPEVSLEGLQMETPRSLESDAPPEVAAYDVPDETGDVAIAPLSDDEGPPPLL